MGAFFMAIIGIIYICIILSKENAAKSIYQKEIREQKSKSELWYCRVNKGPLNNYQFQEKLKTDKEFREKLFDECNEILDSIPELEGIHMDSLWSNEKTRFRKERIMEMIYNAKTGHVSMLWHAGWIHSYDIFEAFSRRPSDRGLRAFIKWYVNELRKNGYPEATIYSISCGNTIVAWYFTDGPIKPSQIRASMGLM